MLHTHHVVRAVVGRFRGATVRPRAAIVNDVDHAWILVDQRRRLLDRRNRGRRLARDELRRVTAAMATPRVKADIDVALTQREVEVLREMANGSANKDIATTLDVSYETVKEHVQRILGKMGVADRTQAALWAVHKGLV